MKLSEQLRNAGSLLDASNAITNWRALALLGLTFVVATLFLSISLAGHSGFLAFVGGLLFLLTLFYGANAVGITLMDAAANEGRVRPMLDAVLASLFSSHRLIGLALLAALGMIALFIVIAIALFLCKIPVLGTLLTVVVLPLGALAVGMSFFIINFVFYPMAAAAVWSGAGVREAVSHLIAIARQKLASVLIQEVLLMVLVGLISLFIGVVVFYGLFTVGGMAAGILSPGGMSKLMFFMHPSAMMGMDGMDGMDGGGAGQMMAMGVGAGLLIAIGMIIPGLITLQGYCQIYLSSLEGLDVTQARKMLDEGGAAMRRKQEEMRQRMEEMQRKHAPTASGSVEPAAPVAPAAAPACPACHAVLEEPDGKFCGECGHQLR
ncbi:hypothetical protein [uncultured Aquitalea sp.]|uniref:hypothetical protein n=1 Tax=uncultured Aquitalea sp. TaxID=540272 RepID=UPI0025E639DA|nr:hypothetical protein [uncultured Aquitalea sp.]